MIIPFKKFPMVSSVMYPIVMKLSHILPMPPRLCKELKINFLNSAKTFKQASTINGRNYRAIQKT